MCQLELFEKAIKVQIIGSKGHHSYDLTLCDVKEFVVKQTKKFGLWLYVDGVQIKPEKIEIDLILSAKYIILTNALVGG
jgi:hypothetical protein